MGKGKISVAVIGGGAGGLCAAIAAAENGAGVTIIERNNRVGKKLLKTGNGRCNLSHEGVTPEDYNHPDFVSEVLTEWDNAALLGFFRSLGLYTVRDAEGRCYPLSDTASSVLDVLRLRCAALGVEERCSTEVRSLGQRRGRWVLRFTEGGEAEFDRVIVSTGGGTQLLKELGHSMIPFSPVLCPLKTELAPIRGLSGLRQRCRVTLWRNGRAVYSESGEVLFRDYGLSGIVVLNLSRLARKGDVLSLNLLPDWDEEQVKAMLSERKGRGSETFTGVFHRRIGEALLRYASEGIPLFTAVTDLRLTVEGCADAANAQVTRGGAAVDEFDRATMESRLHKGLYCIGEALDIDGKCGGYNLHWAFASGLTAGRSCIK